MGPFLAVSVPVGLFLLPPSGAASQPPGCSVSRTHCQDLAPLHTQHIMQGNQGDAKEQDTEEAKVSAVRRPGTEGPQLPGMGLSPNSRMFSVFCAPSLGRALLCALFEFSQPWEVGIFIPTFQWG